MFLKNVPEEVISTRVASAEQQDVAVNQHTAAALARICSYLETHKHFNYPYQFQVNGTLFFMLASLFFFKKR
jgi:zinc finger FYVE domain-containing protein 26